MSHKWDAHYETKASGSGTGSVHPAESGIEMPDLPEQHLELMKTVRDSGAVDFAKLGAIVSEVAPKLFDPNIALDNYIATGYSDVVKVWKTDISATLGLADKVQLQQMKGAPQEQSNG